MPKVYNTPLIGQQKSGRTDMWDSFLNAAGAASMFMGPEVALGVQAAKGAKGLLRGDPMPAAQAVKSGLDLTGGSGASAQTPQPPPPPPPFAGIPPAQAGVDPLGGYQGMPMFGMPAWSPFGGMYSSPWLQQMGAGGSQVQNWWSRFLNGLTQQNDQGMSLWDMSTAAAFSPGQNRWPKLLSGMMPPMLLLSMIGGGTGSPFGSFGGQKSAIPQSPFGR